MLSGERSEELRSQFADTKALLRPDLDPEEASHIEQAASKVLAAYRASAKQNATSSAVEMQHILGMLNQALMVLAGGSERSISRLQQIQDSLQRTSMLQDIIALKSSLADTWGWDGSNWINKTPPPPAPVPTMRQAFSMAYDAVRQEIVLFGGVTEVGVAVDETWIWNGTTWTKRAPLNNTPGARSGHAMAFDVRRQQVVLFGGSNGATGALMNDMWARSISY